MNDEPPMRQDHAARNKRPWQFSLLHLFGLTTLVSVCLVAFSWSLGIGTLVSSSVFLTVATFYRTRAVIRTAAPSLRVRSFGTLVAFGILTSLVVSFAALVAFGVTCSAVGAAIVVPQQKAEWPVWLLAPAYLVGTATAILVLWRNWPRPPKPLKLSDTWGRGPNLGPK